VNFLPPGSFFWLLVHELRISIRGSMRANRIGLIITAAFVTILTVFAGLPVAFALRHYHLHLTGVLVLAIDAAVLVLLTLLLSQTLSSATLALYERADLDLLLSSPIPAHRVLAVRGLAIAMQPLTIFLALLCPLDVPFAFFGHIEWLGAIAVLVSLALTASAVGLWLAMSLFSLIGPRRTRTLGQLLAAFIGAALFLAGQARYMFSLRIPSLAAAFVHIANNSLLAPDGVLAWPARAVVGEPLPLGVFAGVSIALFVGSVRALGARFSRDASVAAGVGAGSRRVSRPVRPFRGGALHALVRKELLLLIRDPALLSQVLLRVLYLLPLVFILLRNARIQAGAPVANGTGALVFIASQLAASLAWITVSAEDAPELLACAPVKGSFVQRAKLMAALLPLAVLLVGPIAFLTLLSPGIALVAALGITAASLSAGLINLWFEAPGQRRHFRRRGTGSLVGNMAVLLVGLAWSATATAAALGTPWSLLGLLLTLLLLIAFRRARTQPA